METPEIDVLDMPSDASLIHRVYENLVTAIYKVELAPGDSFIDLGANVGHHTWQMANAVGADGQGFAIEPVPDFAERVRRVLQNKSIEWVDVVNVAASDYEGECSFFVQPDHIGWSSMFSDHAHPADDPDSSKEITVPVSRLDDAVLPRDGSRLSVIKVDVENAEFAALRGTEALIRKHRPSIVFENNPRGAANRAEYSVAEFFDFFGAMDYHLWSLPGEEITGAEQWADSASSYYLAAPNGFESGAQYIEHYQLQEVVDRLAADA